MKNYWLKTVITNVCTICKRFKKQSGEEGFVFRQAVMADVDRIWEIILQAKEQMRQAGSQQWNEDYPLPRNILSDIAEDFAYVLCYNGRILAYGAVSQAGEPAYYHLTEGEWLNDNLYILVHRLAVADEAKRQGIGTRFMQEVEAMSCRGGLYEFRVDTNYDNYPMQKLLARLGFEYRGKITYPHGERLAYEKCLPNPWATD